MITIVYDKDYNIWKVKKESALSESEQQHLEASMKQNKALMQELAGNMEQEGK